MKGVNKWGDKPYSLAKTFNVVKMSMVLELCMYIEL